jgi:hypothetical protein
MRWSAFGCAIFLAGGSGLSDFPNLAAGAPGLDSTTWDRTNLTLLPSPLTPFTAVPPAS